MKRKVIKQADQAFTITLPIDWVRKNNIDKNSEVNVDIIEKSLIINSNNPISGGSIKVDFTGLHQRNIYRHIIALYTKGIDEIEIISDKDISPLIMKTLNSLIGYGLISHKKDSYVIKEFGSSAYQNLDEIFKRVFQMILLFYEAAIKDIFGEEKETIDNLLARDLEVNKFCFYLQRAINKMSYQDPINGRILFTYSYVLEKISDEIERLWRLNIQHKPKKSKEIRELIELSKEGLSKAFNIYYQFNSSKLDDIYVIREKVREKSMLKRIDPDTSRFIRHIVKIVEEAADLNHLTLMSKL